MARKTNGSEVGTVCVVETITRPSEDFSFGSGWKGFERLERGTLVGRIRATKIRASRSCYAVLPKENVEVGDDAICSAVDT